MALTCGAPDPNLELTQRLATYIDCRAQALGQAGFHGFASGALLPTLLTGCLTIYVALIGYRLIFGQSFSASQVVASTVRVGLVIAFCTSWSSYEAVVYRTVVDGPAELAGAILQPMDLSASPLDETADRLQRAYDALQTGSSGADQPSAASSSQNQNPNSLPAITPSMRQFIPGSLLTPAAAAPASAPVAAPSQPPINEAGVTFLMSTIGSLLAVRVAAGVLLALGPLFVVLSLFESTRGLFVGWLRGLAGTIFATAGVMIVVALELAFVESEISSGSGGAASLSGQGLMFVATFFALIIAAVLAFTAVVARGLSLPKWSPTVSLLPLRSGTDVERASQSTPYAISATSLEPASRAHAVADAVVALGQRERQAYEGGRGITMAGGLRGAFLSSARQDAASNSPSPGPRHNRTSNVRRSVSAARRDKYT